MTGGTLSILRRKGKQFKDKRGGGGAEREVNPKTGGTNLNNEILSTDIFSLLHAFHDEA